MSNMGLEMDLVRVNLYVLYLINTITTYGVDRVFKTFVSNIFCGNSLGTSRMALNGWVIDFSAKYPLRILPFILMCRCTSRIVVPTSTSL